MIMRGFQTGNSSVRSIKQYKGNPSPQNFPERNEIEMPIIFGEDDTKNLSMPHNDPLVDELKVEDCDVTRVIIDTGSSVDLIFKET